MIYKGAKEDEKSYPDGHIGCYVLIAVYWYLPGGQQSDAEACHDHTSLHLVSPVFSGEPLFVFFQPSKREVDGSGGSFNPGRTGRMPWK